MDRRRFLKQSSIGFAGATLCACGGSRLDDPQRAPTASLAATLENSPFRFGFQSYSLRHFSQPKELAREAKDLGLPFVETYDGHLSTDATGEEISRFEQALERVGVEINAFGVEDFSADHEANQRLFQFGQKLGVENLSAYPSKDAFESLQRLVAEYDIRIAIHNHGPEDEQWRRPEWILEAVKDLDPRIGACVDTGHYLRAGVDPVAAIRMLGSRVWGVHLKDYDANSEEQILGQGGLNLVETFQALLDVGFQGPLSLEYESHVENPVPSMLEGLAAAAEALARM